MNATPFAYGAAAGGPQIFPRSSLDRFERLGTYETFGRDRDVRPMLRLKTFDLERAIERIDQPRVLDVMTSVKRHTASRSS